MAKKNPKGKSVKRFIDFPLTEEQKAKKGEAAAKLNENLEAAVAKKKEAMVQHNGKIKELTGKIAKFLHEINAGVEKREVDCVEVKNFEENTVEYYHEGELMTSRDMLPDDRQTEMPIKTKRGPKVRYPVSSEEAREQEEIADVIKLETSKKTKRSAVDETTV